MKKRFFLFLSVFLFLTGCTKKDDTNKAMIDLYRSYYESIEQGTTLSSLSEYYSLSGEIVSVGDGFYRYSIILDNPQVSMYDVVFMAIESDVSYEEEKKMMPSFGIFDEKSSLIPYQVNSNRHFVKGVVISGESDTDTLDLRILVEWNNRTHEKVYREISNVILDQNGLRIKGEMRTEDGAE